MFHYHLVTSKVRHVEARYLGKLGFGLVARHGRIGDELTSFESGLSWEELDRRGFRLRLTELERGAVNVVVQPGQWETPRVDHIGIVLDDDDFDETLERAAELELRIQEHAGRRTFVATKAGYRLELHPPRDWIDELFERQNELRLGELPPARRRPAAEGEGPRRGARPGDGGVRRSRSATQSSASSTAARRAGRSSTRSCFFDCAAAARIPRAKIPKRSRASCQLSSSGVDVNGRRSEPPRELVDVAPGHHRDEDDASAVHVEPLGGDDLLGDGEPATPADAGLLDRASTVVEIDPPTSRPHVDPDRLRTVVGRPGSTTSTSASMRRSYS